MTIIEAGVDRDEDIPSSIFRDFRESQTTVNIRWMLAGDIPHEVANLGGRGSCNTAFGNAGLFPNLEPHFVDTLSSSRSYTVSHSENAGYNAPQLFIAKLLYIAVVTDRGLFDTRY